MNKNKKQVQSSLAFTIVELLIVIVIIGILAAITIVSYTGITKKANEATLQADLANAKKQIALYYTEHGVYPKTLINNCLSNDTITPNPDTKYCLSSSSGNVYSMTPGNGLSYELTATKSTTTYKITQDTSPTDISVTTTPVTAIGAITGTAQIGQTLTAGAVSPAGATVSYKWQSATTSGGAYTDIPNATSSTYVVSPNVMTKYLKLTVTGTGTYAGIQTSTATAQIPADSTNWLTIGAQTWAKANLNVGTLIVNTADPANNGVVEKYCYSNSESNCTTYGAFYQWSEAMQYTTNEGAQGICPAGSHIPTDVEWKVLEMQLGMTQSEADRSGDWRGSNEATQLKMGGSSNLNIPFAGFRGDDASHTFSLNGTYAYLWSSTSAGSMVWTRLLDSSHTNVYRNMNGVSPTSPGFSIRCLGN